MLNVTASYDYSILRFDISPCSSDNDILFITLILFVNTLTAFLSFSLLERRPTSDDYFSKLI